MALGATSRQLEGTASAEIAFEPVPNRVPRSRVRAPEVRAVPRERLESRLSTFDRYRLGLVVAPAGSGKTTLLSRIATLASVPVAWYRAESWDRDEIRLVEGLWDALPPASLNGSAPPRSVDALVDVLERADGSPLVIIIDDLHAIERTVAEAALERLVEYAPPSVTFLAGSRSQPEFNLSRLRVSGSLVEIGSDDLRFRPWEVERLFRDIYEEHVPPHELASLAGRTEGWAAGLQLFHLATRGKTPDERRAILASVAAGPRLTREYLARNVLADLSEQLRSFLVETAVLGRLTGPLCDRLLGRTGSASVLEELERRQIFTARLDEEGSYRYHEVLRTYLLARLVEERGEAEAQARHATAGRLLEEVGALPEAVAAYSRADDRTAVERVLALIGEQMVTATWIDALPPALVRNDPWLLLASARRARFEGRWRAAIEAYQQAEHAFGEADGGVASRRERHTLAAWLEPVPRPIQHWSASLRRAVSRDPLAARRDAADLEPPLSWLAEGLASLMAGDVRDASRSLRAAIDDERLPPVLAAGAGLALVAARLLSGDTGAAGGIEPIVEGANRIGFSWLSRLARVLAEPAFADRDSGLLSVAGSCASDGDPWGEALIWLIEAWSAQSAPDAVAAASRASALFAALGATTLQSWAESFGAMARVGVGNGARDAAANAERLARNAGSPGARLYACIALVRADPAQAARLRGVVDALAADTGLSAEAVSTPTLSPRRDVVGDGRAAGTDRTRRTGPEGTDGADQRPPIVIECFGRFSISVGGEPLDLGAIKPRARAVLRLLALHAGSPVHREILEAELWPDGEREAASRSLHVALSAIRQLLEPGIGRGESSYVVRDGEAYRFDLPDGSAVDVIELERAVREGRAAKETGQGARAIASFRAALDLYRGELLAEDGPADWVVDARDRCRLLVTEAAQCLADLCLEAGDTAEAVRVCTLGLAADRYHDALWRTLMEARDRAGDPTAAIRTRREYASLLGSLEAADDGVPGQARASRAPSRIA